MPCSPRNHRHVAALASSRGKFGIAGVRLPWMRAVISPSRIDRCNLATAQKNHNVVVSDAAVTRENLYVGMASGRNSDSPENAVGHCDVKKNIGCSCCCLAR
jgi:hypothetical protein